MWERQQHSCRVVSNTNLILVNSVNLQWWMEILIRIKEIQGVVVRFISSDTSQMEEKTLNICRSAKEIFEFVRKTLDKSEVSFDGMVSQAYDGAIVVWCQRWTTSSSLLILW